MSLSAQHSGIAKTADSLLGVVLSLKDNESSSKYLSPNALLLLTAALYDSNLFCAK